MAEYSYDAWGRMRNVSNWTVYIAGTEPALLFGRGYTGHEHLPQFGLINMNARLYDPVLGRFVSADPYVADPTSAQAFNWYMYVGNNPLMFTDPTGERRRLLENLPGEEIPQGAFDTWNSGIRMPQRNFWNYVNKYGEAVSNGYQGSQINFVNLCRDQSRQIGFNGEITFRYQYSYVDYITSGVVSTANGYKSVSLPTIGVAAGKYTINLNDYWNNGGKESESKNVASIMNRSSSSKDYFDNVCIAASMTMDWITGQDYDMIFMNNTVTDDLRNSKGVKDAYELFMKIGKSKGDFDFGLDGLIDAGNSPIQQFVGSFHYEILNIDGTIQFTISNKTSFRSAAYHLWPSNWNWENGPMSNYYQTFIFTYP